MPVIGTPVLTPSPGPIFSGPFVVSPPVTQLYNVPIASKMRAACIQQAQYASLQVQLYNPYNLIPFDLTSYSLTNGAGPQGPQSQPGAVAWIRFRFMEAVGLEGCAVDGTSQQVVDAVNGIISCVVPSQVTGNSGVYICEAGVFDSNNNFLFSNTFYVLVDRGLFTTNMTSSPNTSGVVGAPSLNEIRINLRDNPEINRMIDEFEFDVADICDAIVRTINHFNSAPPPLRLQFNTTTFPWRYPWMDGIAAHLYECAAGFYRRNMLKHQTGGLTVDDINREREYLQAWQTRFERWTKWVQMKKVQLNMEEGFMTFGSPYGNVGHRATGWW